MLWVNFRKLGKQQQTMQIRHVSFLRPGSHEKLGAQTILGPAAGYIPSCTFKNVICKAFSVTDVPKL